MVQASTECFKYQISQTIPPDGTYSFNLPAPMELDGGAFFDSAITVTATPFIGSGGSALYMEVIQTAVRATKISNDMVYSLDIVVRNNSHATDPENSTIEQFNLIVAATHYVPPL